MSQDHPARSNDMAEKIQVAEQRLRFLSERLSELMEEARVSLVNTGSWAFSLCGYDEDGGPFPIAVPDSFSDNGHAQALSVAEMMFTAFDVSRYVFCEFVEVVDPRTKAEEAWLCGRGFDRLAGTIAADLKVVFDDEGAIADIVQTDEASGVTFADEYTTLVKNYGRRTQGQRLEALRTLRGMGLYERGGPLH